MPKQTPEQKLAEAVNVLGVEKAEGYIKFLKAMNAPKKERKAKAVGQ